MAILQLTQYSTLYKVYAISYTERVDLKITFEVYKTEDFIKWNRKQSINIQTKIQIRLDRIELDGYFGLYNYFDNIIELKWKSGLRVYTSRLSKNIVIVILGGTKHGQQKDIKKAKKILQKIKADSFTPP